MDGESFETEFQKSAVTLKGLNLYTHTVITNSKVTP